jgi:hypothetical protein
MKNEEGGDGRWEMGDGGLRLLLLILILILILPGDYGAGHRARAWLRRRNWLWNDAVPEAGAPMRLRNG